MLEPSPHRRLLPQEWRPPMRFPVIVRYWDRRRGPDVLWTIPDTVDADGNVLYLAAGPAGKPASGYLVSHLSFKGLPKGSRVQVITDKNAEGMTVFGVPRHTAN